MKNDLIKSHKWYEANRNQMVRIYNGRYIVIAASAVIGDYATEEEALRETVKTHPLGTFIVKKCVPESKEQKIVFHSRVAFV
jgi:hypothetical protein